MENPENMVVHNPHNEEMEGVEESNDHVPNADPETPPPQLSQCTDSSPPANEEVDRPKSPVPDDEDSDHSDIYDSSVACVMEILNFRVVKNPRRDISEPHAGEFVPKSVYLQERRQLLELIKASQEEATAAGNETLEAIIKLNECEEKMERIVGVVKNLHLLYGKLLQIMATSMCTNFPQSCTDESAFLSVGPFQTSQLSVEVLQKFSDLTSQFHNNNYQTTRNDLELLIQLLGSSLCQNLVAIPFTNLSQTGDQPGEGSQLVVSVVPMQTPQVVDLSPDPPGVSSSPSTYNDNDGPPPPPFNEGPPSCNDNLLQPPTNQHLPAPISLDANGFPSLPDLSTPPPPPVADSTPSGDLVTPPPPEAVRNEIPPQMHLSEPETTNDSSAFVPVMDSSQVPPKWTLVELPQKSNLNGKQHGIVPSTSGTVCYCGLTFTSTALLRFHVRYYSATWKYTCTICARKYPGQNFLKLHYLREHNLNIEPSASATTTETVPNPPEEPSSETRCRIVVDGTRCACGTDLGTGEALMAHIREEAKALGQIFQCTHCPQQFNHPCSYKKHLKQNHPDQFFVCCWCDDVFGTSQGLESHTIQEHQLEQQSEGLISNPSSLVVPAQDGNPVAVTGDLNQSNATVTITIVD